MWKDAQGSGDRCDWLKEYLPSALQQRSAQFDEQNWVSNIFSGSMSCTNCKRLYTIIIAFKAILIKIVLKALR